jgi:branched-chain amino acid aminotransferase/4-amino-4-deoxychorismate lyase
MKMRLVNFNGTKATEEELKLNPDNRGFLYGDGIFETLKVSGGKLIFWESHWERLNKGLSVLKLVLPERYDQSWFENTISDLTQEVKLETSRVKIIVWRKPGGLFTPISREADFLITVSEFKSSVAFKDRVIFSQDVKADFSLISSYKTLSSLKYIIAGLEIKEKQVDDVVIFDKEGHVSECLTSNIFWIKNEVIYTPDILCGLVDGVFRKNLLMTAVKAGLEVRTGFYRADKLMDADFVFTTNIAGPSIVLQINKQEFSNYSPIYNRLMQEIL